MATSMRGGAGNGKEKKGTPSSSSTIKKTLKPLSSTPSPSDEKTNSPRDSGKPIPNYLRPTISSSLDPNKQPKKVSTDASVSKPTYTRRRSFDRPPPASQVQRAIRGSPTGGTAGSRDIKTQRSSSFSHKSTASSSSASSARPASERLYARSSSLKDGKVDPNMSKSRVIKKSNLSGSTKKDPVSTYRKKAPKSVTSESSENCENRPSVDVLTLEDDLVDLDAHEVQSLPEMSEMPDSNEELADPTNLSEEEVSKEITLEDVQNDNDEKSMVVDQVEEKTELANPQPVAEELPDVEALREHIDDDAGDHVDEGAGDHVDEGAGDQQEEVEEKVPVVEPTETTIEEEKKEEEKEPMETEAAKEEVEVTEAKDESQTVSSPAVDSATPTQNAQSSSAGKKDKQDYNDVIEETATKLMGGRKNKVLALAGAFETVISLQDSNKS